MSTTQTATEYTEITRETAKAICFTINGQHIWLPKAGLEHDATAKTVNHSLLATKLETAAIENEMVELGEIVWQSEKCAGYDAYLDVFDSGTERRIRIFVPKSMITDGRAPMWLLRKAANKQLDERADEGKDCRGSVYLNGISITFA